MNLPFENKVALVTGAGSGIGLATVKAFAEAGAAVALADIHEDGARSAAEKLVAAGHKALVIRCDVAEEREVAAMVEQTVFTFGRLDAAFNNAGVQSPLAETADVSAEDFDRVNAINLRGVWSCMKYELLPYARTRKRRHRQLLFDRRTPRHSRPGSVSRIQAWGTRADQVRCRRICLPGNSHQRGLSWDHRYADGQTHAGQSSRSHKSVDEGRADWATWPAGRDRRRRSLALQPWRKLRDRSCTRCGWRVHRKLTR